MINSEYQRVVEIAEVSKKICKVLKYDWQNDDCGNGEFQDRYHDEIQKRLKHMGEEYSDHDVEVVADTVYTEVHWNKYKKIYNFDPNFVLYLAETECGELHKEVFDRLPFKSFYISFGKLFMNSLQPMHGDSVSDFIGMYVYIYYTEKDYGDFVNISITLLSEDGHAIPLFAGIRNGCTFQDAVDLDNWPDYIKKLYQITPQREQDIRARQEKQKPYFMLALNACQYLCASNAEIKDIKVSKKDKPLVAAPDGKKKPTSVSVSNVGFRLGQQFEKMYQNVEADNRRVGVKGIRKRPHVRRAHWHHYWTGPGRTILEVRWLEPVFVMGTEEEIDTVVHDVKGDQL